MMLDEDRARELLAHVDVPPTRVNVTDLLAAGKRKKTKRRYAQLVSALAVVAVLVGVVGAVQFTRSPATRPGIALGQPTSADPSFTATPSSGVTPGAPPPDVQCPITPLRVPPGMENVSATVVDPTGRFVGGGQQTGQNMRAVLWTDGQPVMIESNATSIRISDINQSGVATGLVTYGSTDYVFRYASGHVTKLMTPSGHWNIYPYPRIDALGDIIINAEPFGQSGGANGIALLWKPGSTTSKTLPIPKGAEVNDIGDDGTLVGSLYQHGAVVAAYTWDQAGHGHRLPQPNGTVVSAEAIRGRYVTGGVWTGDDISGGIVWNLDKSTYTHISDFTSLGVEANANGWSISQDGQVYTGAAIATLSGPGDGYSTIGADITDDNTIVGFARTGTGESTTTTPAVWHC